MNQETSIVENRLKHVKLLTVKQVAQLLGLHERTIWKMASAGEIPSPIRIGTKAVRWRLNDLETFVQTGVSHE